MSDDDDLRPSPIVVRVASVIARETDAPLRVEGVFTAGRAVQIKAAVSGVVEGLELRLGELALRGQVLGTVGADVAHQRALAMQANVHQLASQLAERDEALMQAKARAEPEDRLAIFEARVHGARERLEQEKVSLRKQALVEASAVVRAPFAGRVTAVHVAPGATVVTGAVLVEIAEVDPLVLVAEVPAWLAARAQVRAEVGVEVDGEPRSGVLARWSPTASDALRRIEIDVPNPDGRLAAGQRALASIDAGTRTALYVPRDALREERTVLVVEHEQARPRRVHVVGGGGDELEVAGALSAGELVVLEAERALGDKLPVVVRFDH